MIPTSKRTGSFVTSKRTGSFVGETAGATAPRRACGEASRTEVRARRSGNHAARQFIGLSELNRRAGARRGVLRRGRETVTNAPVGADTVPLPIPRRRSRPAPMLMTETRGLDLGIRRSAVRGWRALNDLFYASALYPLTLRGRVPEHLRGTPPDPWGGDPAAAAAILDGEFILGRPGSPQGGTPWDTVPGNEDEAAALHGFGWLADLRALGTEAARTRARDLVGGWIDAHARWSPLAWRADVLGERLANWFAAHDFLSAGGDAEFAHRFLGSAAIQARHLGRIAGVATLHAGAFPAVKGLIYCGVCLPDSRGGVAAGLKLLGQELARQILPDGGHIQRNPSLHLRVLRSLIDIHGILDAAHLEVPTALRSAIDRMVPMLRCMRLGDGGLATFNGGAVGDRGDIDAVLAQAAVKGKALSSAPHSGFQRLAAGRTVIVVDAGPPPPPGPDRHAHAGTLSFEMSVGRERLIVNCGGGAQSHEPWRAAIRATAAHSTVGVDDTNSMEIRADGGVGRRPVHVNCQRRESDGNLWLEINHDGYRENRDLVHRRHLYLDAPGEDLRGEDTLIGSGGQTYTARFHLHPRVHASAVEDGETVLLKLAKGGVWRFRAAGGAMALEESVYVDAVHGALKSEQIVVSGRLNGRSTMFKWALRREDGIVPHGKER